MCCFVLLFSFLLRMCVCFTHDKIRSEKNSFFIQKKGKLKGNNYNSPSHLLFTKVEKTVDFSAVALILE